MRLNVSSTCAFFGNSKLAAERCGIGGLSRLPGAPGQHVNLFGRTLGIAAQHHFAHACGWHDQPARMMHARFLFSHTSFAIRAAGRRSRRYQRTVVSGRIATAKIDVGHVGDHVHVIDGEDAIAALAQGLEVGAFGDIVARTTVRRDRGAEFLRVQARSKARENRA